MSRIEQYALDLGDGTPPTIALDSRTGRPLGLNGKPMPVKPKPHNGAEMRNKAIQQAIENEKEAWRELHNKELAIFLAVRTAATFIAEDFRVWFMARGNEAPHHHNVWGAMWMAASRRGLVVKTGHSRQMREVRSHARDTTEWVGP